MKLKRKKKDFNFRAEIIGEFERLAPTGAQTAILEELMLRWIDEQKSKVRHEAIRRAYEKEQRSH